MRSRSQTASPSLVGTELIFRPKTHQKGFLILRKPRGSEDEFSSSLPLAVSSPVLFQIIEYGFAVILGCCAKVFLNAQELVIFSDTVRTARSPGLDLTGVGANNDISNGRIFRFPRCGGKQWPYSQRVLPFQWRKGFLSRSQSGSV